MRARVAAIGDGFEGLSCQTLCRPGCCEDGVRTRTCLVPSCVGQLQMAVLRLCRNTRTAMIHKGAYVACQRHTLTLKAPLEQPALKLYLRSWQHVERRSIFAEGGTCTAEGFRWLVFGQLRKQQHTLDPVV